MNIILNIVNINVPIENILAIPNLSDTLDTNGIVIITPKISIFAIQEPAELSIFNYSTINTIKLFVAPVSRAYNT